MIQKGKLTIPHPFCKCGGRLIKGDIVKSGAIITSDFLKMPAIEYSAVYLESILLNLLSNALKYSSPYELPKSTFNPKSLMMKLYSL
jgi:signal transduction histidine kinase